MMRAIDWQRFFQTQRDKYDKRVFTRTELANAASLQPASMKVALERLVNDGILERYTAGRYGIPGAANIQDLVLSLDASAYVTGMYALHIHRLITQAPREVTCFTNHRHNRSRVRASSLGRLVFVCVTGSAYCYPSEGTIASPEQALCDYIYLNRRKGIDSSDLVTFRDLDSVDKPLLKKRLESYPATVADDVNLLLTRR